MRQPRVMLYSLLGTIAGLAIPLVAYMTIRFAPVLTPQEKELLSFVGTPLAIQNRGWKTVSRSCPVSSDAGMTRVIPDAGQQPYNRDRSTGDTLPRISFILNGDDARMAVIDGYVLKEGSSFDGWRVLRIEQKRVLLDNRKVKKWISIN